tara:strand:+ start:1144 stop:1521 length:378 start_codon:yes stop_codon:yes gene_type:complete
MRNILPLIGIDKVRFGQSPREVSDLFGTPDHMRDMPSGEFEMLYGEQIYRFLNFRLVECAWPDDGPVQIDGQTVLNLFNWLSTQSDCKDRARFRICNPLGIAFDYRESDQGHIVIYEAQHWDGLI